MKKKTSSLKFPLKEKFVALVSPSFVVDFLYPQILYQLKYLGFDKVVELTFGAKLVNKEYYKEIKSSNNFYISSVCPGIVETIKKDFPQYKDNLLRVDSPMIATAKICKKIYPHHKIVFISPCNFKKIEVNYSKLIDFVIDYKELKDILKVHSRKRKIKLKDQTIFFDKFYNDYTKIYPLSGGLSKTLKVKKLLKKCQTKEIDGINRVIKFLKKPNPKVKFLDATFCKGGCIGGPCIYSKKPLYLKKRKILKYLKKSHKERIPKNEKGILKQAEGISFKSNYTLN